MGRRIVVGNWKMNQSHQEALDLASKVQSACENISGVHVILAPSFVSLIPIRDCLYGSAISLAAQNMFYQESGAYTGEISPLMLKEVCDYVILGHSERRSIFRECNETINKKVIAALKHGIRPILCVGESSRDRQLGDSITAVKLQIEESLQGLSHVGELMVAYEPVWAIGTGESASPEVIDTISSECIRSTLVSLLGDSGKAIPILYGGSVNSLNVAEFLDCDQVDGVLVGGASLDYKQFIDIVNQSQAPA